MANWNHRNGRAMTSETTTDTLDRQNQQMTENLAKKISRLRDLAVDIETETKDSNRYLDRMDDDFNSTTGLLSGTVNRINIMMSSGKGNRKICCYLIIALVLVFLILYYLFSWLTSS